MKERRLPRLIPWMIGIATLGGIAVGAFFTANLLRGATGGPVQVVDAPSDAVARGKYLSEAADCAACHTAPGGAPFAGGLPMQSGFGTIYATNITPDPNNGIGRWTADDFWRALHDGVRRDGQQLYPAMPYTSYRGMTRADADAIYAYLMQLRPANVPNHPTDLRFPFNIRMGMRGWNLLFLTDTLPAASAGHTPAWQRGRYVVDVLGHCGECHTPRGFLGQMELSRPMTGSTLGRFEAPDITPEGLAGRGWTQAAVREFLGSGQVEDGSAFSDMHLVVMLSTRHLTANDLSKAATYLMGDRPPPPTPLPDAPTSAELAATVSGRVTYVALCAGCHGFNGEGVPNTVVPMHGNTTLRLANPRNLIVSMLDGLPAQSFPYLQRMQAMPPFADKLSDAQAAELANYLRVGFGGQKRDVTADVVHALR
jgi:mono/diheme cytochrome c family protein